MCYCEHNANTTSTSIFDKEDNTCYEYQYDMFLGVALTNSVAILVTVVNIVIRTINIKLIGIIGFATKS